MVEVDAPMLSPVGFASVPQHEIHLWSLRFRTFQFRLLTDKSTIQWLSRRRRLTDQRVTIDFLKRLDRRPQKEE
jgi:hypothetical protein